MLSLLPSRAPALTGGYSLRGAPVGEQGRVTEAIGRARCDFVAGMRNLFSAACPALSSLRGANID